MRELMMRWIAIVGLTLGAGCTSQLEVLTEETNVIHVSDFSQPEPTVGEIAEIESPSEPVLQDVPVVEEVVVEAPEAPSVEEQLDEFMPQRVGVTITVEALVGQVNGRPVYANRVLEPLVARLRAGARQVNSGELNLSAFKDSVKDMLFEEAVDMGTVVRGGRVYELVITDLLLSEAQSNMSKEESHGVFALIGQMRSDLVSSQGGSHAQLRESIEEQTGSTVDAFLDMQRDEIMIDALQRQEIWPKVNVTWRDIQREFEKLSPNKSVPLKKMDEARVAEILGAMQSGTPLKNIAAAKGSITLGMIRLPIEDPQVETVKEGFANGLSFKEVARSVHIPDDGFWGRFELGAKGLQGIDVADFFKEKLQGAQEGEMLPSFEYGTGHFWIAVLEIEQPVSLYNRSVQIALRNVLRWIAFNKEQARFVESLWGKGSIDKVDSMADRVKNIADRRFLQ
jgi:hypothetical protein